MNYYKELLSNYDLSNPHLEYKIGHSYRVMNNMILLAKNMNLPYKDIHLAAMIGLFHDYGRFHQYKQYQEFNDKLLDHGEYGANYLETHQELFSKYHVSELDYQIAYTAIRNHNKYKIDNKLTKRELLFTKMIRDADKLDIFYALSNESIKPKIYEDNHDISNEVTKIFYEHQPIDKNIENNINDNLIKVFSFIYDINFHLSLDMIKYYNYFDKIYNRLHHQELFKPYIEHINNYLNERID